MYFTEFLAWKVNTATARERAEDDAIAAADSDAVDPRVYEDEYLRQVEQSRESVSNTPRMHGRVYVYNETVLEMRGGMLEAWRGLVAPFSVALILVTIAAAHAVYVGLSAFFAHEITSSGLIVGSTIPALLSVALPWLYLKYGFRISRLEIFTSRHLLIRFNWVTRQVYLHRPKYCGGIVTLPWEGINCEGAMPSTPDNEHIGDMGLPLGFFWDPQATGLPHLESAFGTWFTQRSKLNDTWEFIRRFMEDGPEGLPKPHVTWQFPWPWQAFTPQFEGLSGLFSNSNIYMQWGMVLMAPAYLAVGLGHWLSLMLCWKPRWPKIIREAGRPGKPVPPFTTLADYPPDIQERLLANADRWALLPGDRPSDEPPASTATRVPRIWPAKQRNTDGVTDGQA